MTRLVRSVGAALCLVVWGAAAGADGGAPLRSGPAGPVRVSVWVSPLPLRAGVSEWSVLVLDAEGSAVPGMTVEIALRSSSSPGAASAVVHAEPAGPSGTPYIARLRLPAAGIWQALLRVRGPAGGGELAFDLAAAPEASALAAHGRALALPAVALGLFAIHQWLRLRRRPTVPANAHPACRGPA